MSGVVSQERTGWRDQHISQEHRQWGYDCPALDIDFLMLEYDSGKAIALVEFKHEHAEPLNASHPSIRAIRDLAVRADIPAFVCRYADDMSWWYPTPLNEQAKAFLPEARHLSKRDWVELLYRLRGRKLPSEWSEQPV